jgi:hypothetical protein
LAMHHDLAETAQNIVPMIQDMIDRTARLIINLAGYL